MGHMIREAAPARPQVQLLAGSKVATRALLPALTVLVSGTAALAWFLHEAFVRLDSLQASAWDLGFDQQVVWNIANGHNFYSSFSHSNFLTDHFELILVLPALIERLWPDPRVLLILGDLGLAATAPAGFLMLRAVLGDGVRAAWLAAALAAPIPYWASTQQAARDDFHPENIALALAMLAAWAGLRGRTKLMWALVLLVLTCKEDQVYTVGVIGLLVAGQSAPEFVRRGRWVVAAAAGWLVVMVGGVQNVLRFALHTGLTYTLVSTGQAPKQDDYYAWLVHPTLNAFMHTLANAQGWEMLAIMTAGMCGLPLLRPRWFLLVGPPFAANLMSHHQPQAALVQHYALLPMFPLIVAGAMGAKQLLAWAPRLPGAAIAAMAVPALGLGYLAGSLPPGHIADPQPYGAPDASAGIARVQAVIPAGASVAADDGITPWLAARAEIHGFPGEGDATAYVVIDREAHLSPASWRDKHNAAVAALSTSGRRLLYDDGRLQVWSPVGG